MEDLIYGLIGVGVIYVWIHTVVICFKKLNKLTQYEKALCYFIFDKHIIILKIC